jgi:hypothetical protein
VITRPFNIVEDYEDLKGWWQAHGHKVLSKESLSPVGFIYEESGIKVCACFLFVGRGCKMAQIGWATSNPEAKLKAKYRGFVNIVKNLLKAAESLEIDTITAATSSRGFGKILNKGLEQVVNHEFYIAIRS